MRLRVKQQKGDEEPSTSAGHLPPSPSSSNCSPKRSTTSPASPIGRVAKRNARLLNGLDLGPRASGYSEHLVGTIPEFSIRSLSDACPAINQALEAAENGVDAHGLDEGLLTDLQFQLENLLADNVDWQKNISGEMTFLSTGDYPTDDLHSRLMPSYELRSDNITANLMDVDDPQPSISYVDHFKQDEDDAGSDVISSMDEKELDEPYCVLDIPHRFWTWVREYIGHVDEKFLRDFDQNFYHRYHSDQMEDSFINEPFKYKPVKNPHSPSNHNKHLNGVHKNLDNTRKVSKNSIASTSNGFHEEEEEERVRKSPPAKKRPSVQAARDSFLKSLKSEDNPGDLMKRLVAAYVDEQTSNANKNGKSRGRKPLMKSVVPPKVAETKKKRPSKGDKPAKRKYKTKASKLNGEVNGKLNGHLNGVESTDDESHNDLLTKTDLMESIGKALSDCVLPFSAAGNDLEQEVESEEENEEESEEGEEEPDTNQEDTVGFSNNMENFELIKLKLDSKHSVSDLDEVSTELLKAQQKLEQLVKKTSPILNKCKKELEAEHAYWVTTRALNSIDDELFRVTNQIPNGAINPPEDIFKHCLEIWDQRKRFLLNHYIRDHVKFVQYAEKSTSDAQKIEAVMGIRTPDKRFGETSMEQGAKTRSNRKKSAVKKELHVETLEND